MNTDDDPQKGRELAVRSSAPMPLAQAARSLENNNRPFPDGLELNDLLAELEASFHQVENLELMLFTQARVLDAMFKRIVAHDMHTRFLTDNTKSPTHTLQDHKVNLALRSQRQARQAIEALTKLRDDHE